MMKSEFAKILEQKIGRIDREFSQNPSEKAVFESSYSPLFTHYTPVTEGFLGKVRVDSDLLKHLYKKTKSYQTPHSQTVESKVTTPAPTYHMHIKEVDGATYIAWLQLRTLGGSEFQMDSLSWEEAKKAFRSLARQLHPDTGTQDTPEKFLLLKAAYEVLEEHFLK